MDSLAIIYEKYNYLRYALWVASVLNSNKLVRSVAISSVVVSADIATRYIPYYTAIGVKKAIKYIFFMAAKTAKNLTKKKSTTVHIPDHVLNRPFSTTQSVRTIPSPNNVQKNTEKKNVEDDWVVI